MTRTRRIGAIVGGLAGLAIGLLLSLFISLLANLSLEGLFALVFVSGLFGVIGAGIGVERADLLDWSVRRLSSYSGRGSLHGQPMWPEELSSVALRLSELERERDAAQAAQRFVQQRLEAIVAGLRDGIIIVDPDLNIVSINEAARAMLRAVSEEPVGRSLVEISRDADLVRITREAIERGATQTTPIDYRRAGRQFNVRVQPIIQDGRRLAILVVQDITNLRQLENVRKDFVSNVSHELRTPLAAIRALAETLVDGAVYDEAVAQDFLQRVLNEVDRLNELIEDLLDLGRLESGRMPLQRSTISVKQLLHRVIERTSADAWEAGVAVRVDADSPNIMLNVDVSRMEQVLINLADNAIKFSPRGETVSLSWRMSDAGVEISVVDQGEGILAEDLPRIFERFYKSDRSRGSSGTGLGLAIAKHIVAAHGGDLSAESAYGYGSTFTVRLPASEISADPSADPAHPERHRPEC